MSKFITFYHCRDKCPNREGCTLKYGGGSFPHAGSPEICQFNGDNRKKKEGEVFSIKN